MSVHNGEYVALEQNMCMVCGQLFDTNSILMQKQINKKFKKNENITGYGLCPEHQELFNQDYIALITVKNSENTDKQNLKLEEADRTGELMHVKRNALNQILNKPVAKELPVLFVSEEFSEEFKLMVANAQAVLEETQKEVQTDEIN